MALGSLGTVFYDIVANDMTGAGITSSRAGLMTLGAAFTGVGMAAVAMTDDIKASFLEFDTAMTEVKALGGLTTEEFNLMRDTALDLSKQMPITATDFANAMYLMVSVGYDYQTMMATIPEAAELAVAGSMSMAEATNSIINVFGAYGDKAGDAADITKVFANAVGVGKYEMTDFMTEIMKNIGVASQLGISFSDLAAYNVALQNSFTSSEEAGTSFNRMLLTMTTTGAAKMKELGISLTDSTGKFRDLTDIMADVKVKLDGVSNEQERLNILNDMFGTYGQRAAIAIMNQTDALPGLKKEMAEMNLIEDQFATKQESVNSKLEIAENKMRAAEIALGEGMAPAMILTADAVSGLASVLEDLPEPLQAVGGMSIYAAQGLAALGPVLMGLAGLKMLGLGGIFSGISGSIQGLLAGMSSDIAAGGMAAGGSLAAAIGAGAVLGLAGVWILVKTGVMQGISDIGRSIESSPLGSQIMDALKVVLAPIGSLGAGIIALVQGDFERIPEVMIAPFEQAGEAITRNIDRIRDAFGGIGTVVTGGVQALGGAVNSMVQSFAGMGSIGEYASAAFGNIGGAFNAMAGQVRGVFSQMFSGILGMINSTAAGFRAAGMNIITSIVNGIVAAAGGIVNAIKAALDKVRALFPFSPAKEGPLAETPNWGTWMSAGMEAAGPEVAAAASTNLAAPAAAGVAGGGPAATGGGGGNVTIEAGAIVINGAGQNAEEIANEVIKQLAQQMAGTRKARGLIS